MWIELILFLFLAVCAVFDGIWKKIPLAVVWLGILTAILLRLEGAMGEPSWLAAGLSLTPGILFWLLSFISGEKVGYGDGWVLMMIGLFSGAGRCFLILLTGLAVESFLCLLCWRLVKYIEIRKCRLYRFCYWEWGWWYVYKENGQRIYDD